MKSNTIIYLLIFAAPQWADEVLARLMWADRSSAASRFEKHFIPRCRYARNCKETTQDEEITMSCLSNSECPGRSFCKIPDGQCNNNNRKHYLKGKTQRDTVAGNCTELSFRCTRIYRPVCGCNDKTYSNSCICHSNKVSIAHYGAC